MQILVKKRPDNPKHKFRLHTVAAFRLWRGFEEYFERHPANKMNLNYIVSFVNGTRCMVVIKKINIDKDSVFL